MRQLLLIFVLMLWQSLVLSISRSLIGGKHAILRSTTMTASNLIQLRHRGFKRFKADRLNASPKSKAGSGNTMDSKPLKKPDNLTVDMNSDRISSKTLVNPVNGSATAQPRSSQKQNLSGRRVPDSERLRPYHDGTEKRPMSTAPPKDIYEEFTLEFRKVIRNREFLSAVALYARMKSIGFHPRESVLTGLLSICQKKEHLADAKELFAAYSASGIVPNESAYMSLIRCYSDNGEINVALELIEQMFIMNLEPKLRTYHPVLEAVCLKNDFQGAMDIIKQMKSSKVIPRSEQLTLLLEVGASSGAINVEATRNQIDEMIFTASHDLLGMETSEMRRIVGSFCKLTPQGVLDEGILVETREDLPGEILEITEKDNLSLVTSMNETFHNVPTVLKDMIALPPVIGNTIPIGFDTDYLSSPEYEPDVYTIASESELLQGAQSANIRNKRARMVDISKQTSICPNCGVELIPLVLDEEERKRVRHGLMRIAASSSMTQLKNIQAFGEWLKLQSEFKYVIDGANVAYHYQNFESGRFSYRQIELVVDKMLARGDGNVLVLLPYSYAQKVVPNSSKHKGKKSISYASVADQRILQRLEEERMLYLVPPGADDDWYWIYTTVMENRTDTAFVVTNDQMRDHRLAFLEPRPFIRWRTTQVLNFCFSKAAKEDTADPETYIINPAKYSREIQRGITPNGEESERWHVPASDRRAWLCLSTRDPLLPPNATSFSTSDSDSVIDAISTSVSTSISDSISTSNTTDKNRSNNESSSIADGVQ